MASEADLTALRKCGKEDCGHIIPNGVKELKNILMAMSNHLAVMHPASGGFFIYAPAPAPDPAPAPFPAPPSAPAPAPRYLKRLMRLQR